MPARASGAEKRSGRTSGQARSAAHNQNEGEQHERFTVTAVQARLQVALDGALLTLHREDVVRDEEGNVIAVRPRGHGEGSEGEGTEGLRSALGLPLSCERANVSGPVGVKVTHATIL